LERRLIVGLVFDVWLEPAMLVEVLADEITPSRHHRSF
jgi:hypothetical protein